MALVKVLCRSDNHEIKDNIRTLLKNNSIEKMTIEINF